MKAVVALGSNLGNCKENLNIAKTLLKEFKKVKVVKVIVHKPKAPISLKFTDISVEITRKR